MKVKIVKTEEGNWVGIYVDGILKRSDSDLSAQDILEALEVDYSFQELSMEQCAEMSRLPNLEKDLP